MCVFANLSSFIAPFPSTPVFPNPNSCDMMKKKKKKKILDELLFILVEACVCDLSGVGDGAQGEECDSV